jgi:hypothetical protein
LCAVSDAAELRGQLYESVTNLNFLGLRSRSIRVSLWGATLSSVYPMVAPQEWVGPMNLRDYLQAAQRVAFDRRVAALGRSTPVAHVAQSAKHILVGEDEVTCTIPVVSSTRPPQPCRLRGASCICKA